MIAKVRDADDAVPTDAHHFGQEALHVLHRLQGLGQDHAVKLPGGKGALAMIQVGLDDIQPAADIVHALARDYWAAKDAL